jgi:transcriptional regulator with XRE-family HTH domain
MSGYDDDSGALGAYIRAQRQLADMSIRQLADVAKVSNAYLSQLERGLHQPSLRILASIAEALSIPSQDLLLQAGMSNGYGAGSDGMRAEGGADTVNSLLADPHLSAGDKQILVQLYRTLRSKNRTSGAQNS